MQSGDRLGHYEITGHLGSGGMGEVYRARDTSLQREVAVKVLPAELSTDAERLARFEREARMLAQLDHPNIAAVHGLDRDGDRTFLVMQLAPGETLDERIGGAPIDPADAVAIARQIAEGMEAAHERGIVHRDLKPANVMVAGDGSVKILDFGLAKALAGEGDAGTSPPELSASPTMMAGTVAGVILGTAAYMSPEQARGLPVDRRADIWAFGCVLYEMLAGRPPFTGETVTDVLASVVKEDPDWSALPESTPPALATLLRRCLEKNPKQRLRDIGEARIALEGGSVLAASAEPAAAPASRPRSSAPIIVGIVAAAVVAIVLAALLLRPAPADAPLLRAAVSLPPDMLLNVEGDNAGPPRLSPDGRRMVFGAATPATPLQLWIRDLDDPDPVPLAGTEGGYFPFWSPDGGSIAFFARDRLLRMDLETQQILTVADGIDLGRPGAWHPDGSIYYAPGTNLPLAVANANGQSPPVSWPMDRSLHSTQRWVQLLPDGEHVLYFAGLHDDLDAETNGLWVARRDGSEMQQLLRADSGGVYADGHLLFVREKSLMAQRFDPDELALIGDPQQLGESVSVDATTWGANFTAADNGTLIYLPADQPIGRILRWVDREGNRLETWQPAGNYVTIRLSPDDRWLMAEFQQTPRSQLYLYDMSGRSEQVTFGLVDNTDPTWAEDGEIVYHARWGGVGGTYDLFAMPYRGGTSTPFFARDGTDTFPFGVSSELGVVIAGTGQYFSRGTSTDLWAIPIDGSEPYRLEVDAAWEAVEAAVSHDGRSLAITARSAGNSEPQLYVSPLVRVDGRLRLGEPRRQISIDGGYNPRWRGDDGEIFFVRGSGILIAATLERGDIGQVVRSGTPEVLFSASLPFTTGGGRSSFDVTSDGQRFVILETNSEDRQLTLVSDWRRALPSSER